MIRLESDWTTKQGLIQQMGQGEGATVVMGSSEESNEQQKELQKLQSEFEEEKNLRSELELKISQLENELKTAKSETERKGEDWRFKELKFQQMIRKLEEELQHSKSMKLKLEKELQNMELKEKELNNVITNLQKTVKNLEENVEKLEYQKDQFKKNLDSLKGQTIEYTKSCSSDLKQENAFLTTKIEQTESQLERVRENLAKEKASQKELREQLRKKQDELSEIKMDVRISRREAKQAEDIVSTLRDSNRQLREKSITLEKEKNEWHDQEKTLQEKITQLEADLQTKEKTLDEQKNAFKTEKAKLEERIKALRENCGTTKELEEKYAKSQGKYEELSNQIQLLKDQVSAKEHEKEQSVKGYNEIKQELAEEKKKIKSLEANITLLKSTCTSLEDQLKDYDVVTDTQEETIAKLEREKATLKKDIQCIEEEMKNLELSLSREKKARLENEHKLLELEEEQETNQAIWKAKIETAQEQLAYQREVSSQLSEQVSELERQLATQSQSLKQFHQKVTSLEEDNIQVKEEAAKHITQISSLKASNLKLTQGLEEALEKVNQSKDQIEELYNTAEITKVSHEHEKIKLQETIAQQTKLIDFLQAKVQGLEKKKKRFFGNKGRETGSSTIPLQWRELEGMLERERAKCRRLQEQLDKSRAEVMACKAETGHISKTHGDLENTSHLSVIPTSPKSRAVLSALALSPDVNINNSTDSPTTFITKETASTYRKPQGQRMHHNIPHRFQEVLTMRGTKCAACLDSIHFGRIASRCLECGVTCHTKCSTSLPSTCCLPSGYVQHFTDTLQKKNSNNSQHRPSLKVTFADNNSEEAADITQGWVKLPRSGKQGWEKHYLRLENRTLYILDKENIQSISATDSINLCPADGEVLVTSAVSATDLIGTAKTDLPYVLKIESFPHTTCWPPRCLYIMVPSFAEKQMWVSALESVVKTNEKAKDEELLGSSILHLEGENRLDINCTCHLNDNIILVGAMEGLYTVDILAEPTHSLQTKIDGVPSVYQVAVLETLNTVLLIIGEERKLKMLDLTTLNRWVKGDKMTINEEMTAFQPVSEIEACHLFGTSEDTSSVCAATSSTVFLLKWNVGLHTFCLRKEIKTAEPCSCIHFTTNSVIFGAEKFFELDLKDHSVEEFLDVSDTSLAFLAYGASQLRSFPVAILQVASEECLLCFHELGVFVDSFGKRSRKEDMKWTRLPLAFAYRAPYLFVIHFNSVEVVEIRPQQSTEMGAHTFLEVANPRYLGPAMFIGSVYISSSHDNQMEILCVQGKLTALSGQDVTDTVVRNSSSDSSSSEESDGTEFSFTPSVIQSLDANLSELSEVSSSASLP
ncbi:citron Rho-interacting kinase-like isoform X2 [Tachypleus tridentatus]|uniref:citron Rho-interacting kinase-like isoform X2 n=1 Tax=Tachypleus tridentatus TaxID=6853 RepID=UPI003FD5E5C4